MNFSHSSNNLGFLRLVFATLVIVAHAPAIIEGHEGHELLSSILGSRTFGEIAVDGFFLISGFLIVKSYQNSESKLSYLIKRVRRIYPGYLVAVVLCMAIAPLTDYTADFSLRGVLKGTLQVLVLNGVPIDGFIGMPYPFLNGSLWTISYEFRCYLMVLVAGGLGLFMRRTLFVAVSFAVLMLSFLPSLPNIPGALAFFIGYPGYTIRFVSAFCVGACFYLYRDRIALTTLGAMLSAAMLLTAMAFKAAETQTFAVFGGYLIFWFAFSIKSPALARINSNDDISYGVYLYGWPISSALVYAFNVQSPALLIVISIPIAYLAGYLSWICVEKPAARAPRQVPA
jgi:peptidoglycan/LPS O-acetylase OafA/YrhL